MSDKKKVVASGHERVAAFLLSLDRTVAAKILKSLKPDVVVQVSQAMLDLNPQIGQESQVNDLYRELAIHLNGPKHVQACDDGELHAILAATYGDAKGSEVLDQINERRLRDRPFLRIEAYPAGTLFRVLRNESQAVCSLVLANLPADLSSKVIRMFDDEQALEIVKRMATLSPPTLAVLQALAANLEESLVAVADEPEEPDPADRLRGIAELLNFATPELEKNVIEAINEDDQDMAAELREFMFTWEDIGTIDKRAMQKILGTVDTKTLSVALKAASPEVEEAVLSNLSSRVREMVAEERELAGAVPLSTVTQAREDIMKNIRAMIESGEFSPSRAGEELVS